MIFYVYPILSYSMIFYDILCLSYSILFYDILCLSYSMSTTILSHLFKKPHMCVYTLVTFTLIGLHSSHMYTQLYVNKFTG